MKTNPSLSLHSANIKRAILVIVLGLIGLYVVLPKLHLFGLSGKLQMPRHWSLVILALALFQLTFIISAQSYRFLALTKLKMLSVSLIQFASVPLNLLLPAGIGNISINYLFLKRHRHNNVTAALVVTMNNSLGVVGNLSVLILLFSLFGLKRKESLIAHQSHFWIICIVVSLLVLSIITLSLIGGHIKKLKAIRRQLIKSIVSYKSRPVNLAGAYMCAASQALVTSGCLWFCLAAYGIHLSYPTAFLIYALSVMVGSAIPTPGGLGGVEASLVAGIVASHAAGPSVALSAVLAYRAISYWLPVVLGILALFIVEQMRLLQRA